MSDEPTPDAETQEVPVEAKPGKKPKADKKKPIEPSQPEGDQAAPVEASGAIEPPPAAEPAIAAGSAAIGSAAAESAPSDRDDDVFQQGIQALLRGEYDAADIFFGQALITYRAQDNRAGQIDVMEQLGHLCFLRGAEAQAREYYQQAGLMRAV
jgi:outer membrane biosynthesis protein TonB